MKRYDLMEVCPKCAGTLLPRLWGGGRRCRECHTRTPEREGEALPERLAVVCSRCGWADMRLPLDAPEDVA